MLQRLPVVVPPAPNRPGADPDNPMRKVAQQIAFEPTGWTPERAAKVAELFDGLASGWHERMTTDRVDAVADALERGGPFPTAPALELGSGIGFFSARLLARLERVVSVDLSTEMLRLARADVTPRVQADASQLPFPDATFGVVVLINMFLFPNEMARVLRDDGVVVWVNTRGAATPIHLSPDEVERALPGSWAGVESDAGWGIWAALRRA